MRCSVTTQKETIRPCPGPEYRGQLMVFHLPVIGIILASNMYSTFILFLLKPKTSPGLTGLLLALAMAPWWKSSPVSNLEDIFTSLKIPWIFRFHITLLLPTSQTTCRLWPCQSSSRAFYFQSQPSEIIKKIYKYPKLWKNWVLVFKTFALQADILSSS